ncbi:MAG: glycosyltransferase [Chloroflexota bacterium]
MAGGWWLVAGGWWLVAGGWWLVAGGWWLVAWDWGIVNQGAVGQSVEVSVIFTVLNDAPNVERLLNSLALQTRQPNEVVICDGGSHDGTVEAILDFNRLGRLSNLTLLIEDKANISRGRNVAIAAAKGSLIAVTDVGVRLDLDWLDNLIEPWESTIDSTEHAQPLAVAGFFLPDVDSAFTAAMGATVLPLHEDIDPDKFLPSSRSVAFTKAAWAAAGGYPEWLDYCEDLLFDFAVNAQRPYATSGFVWAPKAIAYFRPRDTLRSFWRQYFFYARGDGKADLWRKRHAIRYITYLIIMPLLVCYILWSPILPWLGWMALCTGGVVYCSRPWQRLRIVAKELAWGQRLLALFYVPIIRIVGDVAKMVGYPIGLGWRWRNRHRPEVHWQ